MAEEAMNRRGTGEILNDKKISGPPGFLPDCGYFVADMGVFSLRGVAVLYRTYKEAREVAQFKASETGRDQVILSICHIIRGDRP